MSTTTKSKKQSSNDMDIENIYKKKDQITHVLDLPDTYIGSVEPDNKNMWIYDDETKKIIYKDIYYVPGFYKIIDELTVNARDHVERDKTCNLIEFNFDKESGSISILNNGEGIPIQIHKEHNVYVPELIFGQLLTSANYDQKGKTVGGKNGYGSKLANIFSKKFIIETVDIKNKKKYYQEFSDNMSKKTEPIVTNLGKKDTPYTKITILPDYERFGMKKGLSNDVIGLLKKRAYDIAACTDKNVKVYLNGELLKIKSFQDFIELHYDKKPNMIYEEINDRWKVGVVFNPDSGKRTVSFVNGIWTYAGGTHVNYIFDQIVDKLKEHIKKKNKNLNIMPGSIKDCLNIFIDSVIEDPSFSSQTKGELTTNSKKFGSTCELDNAFITKVFNTGLADWITKLAQFKEMSGLKQTDGKKVTAIRDIPKLEDAHWAGTKKSKDTRLILTEGDSAKAFAISGIKVLGRDKFGVFPLRGKLLNVRNATAQQIKNNKEFIFLKKILGLKQDVKYNDVSKLRYGGIIILTDQDADGSHIKGLIINLFQYFWPELLKIDGFIETMSTPLIKAFKKADKKNNNTIVFYTLSEFEKWAKKEEDNMSKWHIKYYKGLGTSDEKEAKEVFNDYENRIIDFIWEDIDDLSSFSKKSVKSTKSNKSKSKKEESSSSDESSDNESSGSDGTDDSKEKEKDKKSKDSFDKTIYLSKSYDSITLAFDEKRANDRKVWLGKYHKDNILEYTKKEVNYTDFINKDLIHFSNMDNIRSIPSIVDGFKPSHRKILYAMFKKNQKSEIKVAQLASYVAEHTAYKHGENSLQEAIVGMGQNFPGSNNINLIFPSGNFGYRNQGGEEHASPRYIFTKLDQIASKIFIEQDECILNYQIDEGEVIEPDYYYPIIPMILVNGSKGIGTGYSTNIPQYNPMDICDNIYRMMDNKKCKEMHPWYCGFNGKIEKIDEGKYKIMGNYEVKGISEIRITEIPIRGNLCWTQDYKEYLYTLIDDKEPRKTKEEKDKEKEGKRVRVVTKKLEDVISNCGNNEIDFTVKVKGMELQKMVKSGDDEIEKYFKLSANLSVSNLYLYNHKNIITKYDTPLDIMQDFYDFRLEMYKKRKEYYLRILINELLILKNKVRFIQDIIDKKILIERKKKEDIIAKLEKLEYPRVSTKFDAVESEKTYNYLTGMELFSLTEEKIDELNKKYNDKKKEYEDYKSTTELEFWRRELDDFVDFYKKWTKIQYEHNNDEDTSKKSKAKKKAK